jgi:hypothetical protein
MTIPSASLPEILKSVNWQGDRNRLVAFCNDFTQTENRIKGNLCMDGNTCHRFELELEYNTPLLSDKRRTAMLQLLVRHHLLSREQSHNLKKWPGQSEITWRSSAYTFERWLDMKICCEPCGAIIAKPYLGFAPRPRLGWNRQEVDD